MEATLNAQSTIAVKDILYSTAIQTILILNGRCTEEFLERKVEGISRDFSSLYFKHALNKALAQGQVVKSNRFYVIGAR